MTTQDKEPAATGETEPSLLAALVPRLPRMIAVSGVALAVALLGVQLIPQTFEARLPLALAAGTAPETEAERILAPEQLADLVSRLAPERVAELRSSGGGAVDSIALVRQRLALTPNPAETGLNLTVTAPSAALARAIADAAAISYASLAEPPPRLPQASEPTEDTAEPSIEVSAPADPNHIQLLQQKLSFAWEDRVRLEGRAERIAGLVADGNYALLALEADGLPGLGRKLDQLADLETERETLSATLLPAHPTMRTVVDRIGTLSDEVSSEVAALVDLVDADSQAARRLEETLRTELAAATAPKLVDTETLTGATTALPQARVTALPRPIRTELVLALVGGMAFFGQVGAFALGRRQRPTGHDDAAGEEVISSDAPAAQWHPVAPQSPAASLSPPAPEPFWLAEARTLNVAVEADWALEDSAPNPAITPLHSPQASKEPAKPAKAAKHRAKSLDRLQNASIVALRKTAMDATSGRDLAAHLLAQGRRVVLVDAASRRRTNAPGISDLSLGQAGFADIIHGSGLYQAAHIPWGCQSELDTTARPVRILVQALSELYDVVVLLVAAESSPANDALLALAEVTLAPTDVPDLGKRSA